MNSHFTGSDKIIQARKTNPRPPLPSQKLIMHFLRKSLKNTINFILEYETVHQKPIL